MDNHKSKLLVELQKIEKEGISLWMEGVPSNSMGITNEIFVNEEDAYMRDYIYDKGVLKELRFEKLAKDIRNCKSRESA